MGDVHIRDACATDAAAIAAVYNTYITETAVTFDTEPVGVEERREWLARHDHDHPVVIAEVEGKVVGWGALSRWAHRPAWHRTAEVSIYVAREHHGEGVGHALMEALIVRGRDAGHHVLIGQIVAGNTASLAMAEHAGFERAGVLREVGDKLGSYHDLVLMQRILS
ncbi:MAG: N-acetyltransferase family protein [Coriobacteriia bacterium]|nr:N-acetyltransferase family protein [Coriobacteriia bacterium]